MKTTGHSRPLAACTVVMVTFCNFSLAACDEEARDAQEYRLDPYLHPYPSRASTSAESSSEESCCLSIDLKSVSRTGTDLAGVPG